MKVLVVGSGYVGLVTGACFAEVGNGVVCVDVNEQKIEKLRKGEIPIYEPGLGEIVKNGRERGNLHFSTKIEEGIKGAQYVFIAVGTPMGEDGSADLSYVLEVAKSIGRYMQGELIVVDKSTVPIGTADKVREVINGELERRGENIKFDVVSNPEFLKEGKAIDDFMKPDRVVIGADNEQSIKAMKKLYKPFFLQYDRFITMDIRSAEMTKYAANSMLATKISFMNEIANICERVGADVNKVRLGIGSDSRIGYSFIYPGCGYGGSCFPKDVVALNKLAQEVGYKAELMEAVEAVNGRQKRVIVEKIVKKYGDELVGKTFGVWGLSFKPETDDMREAPSIEVIKELVARGAKIRAYDPKAIEEARSFYLKGVVNVEYFGDKYSAIEGCDGMILLTEWKEFRTPDFEKIGEIMKEKVIFDGRNQYGSFELDKQGWYYSQIGVGV